MSPIPTELGQVYAAEKSWAMRARNGAWNTEVQQPPRLLFPGAFNPLHDGHLKLAQFAANRFQLDVCFEIAIRNADKPAIAAPQLLNRLEQFQQNEVLVTDLPSFTEKSRHFPGCHFVIGIDTAIRIMDLRFYNNSFEILSASLSEIDDNGCRFIVAPRLIDGEVCTFSDFNIFQNFSRLFHEIRPQEFRVDLSSTELRSSTSLD